MRCRVLVVGIVLSMTIAVVSLLVIPVGARSIGGGNNGEEIRGYNVQPMAQPNIQSIWDYRTLTPMERPSDLAGKEVLTEEEAAASEGERLS